MMITNPKVGCGGLKPRDFIVVLMSFLLSTNGEICMQIQTKHKF